MRQKEKDHNAANNLVNRLFKNRHFKARTPSLNLPTEVFIISPSFPWKDHNPLFSFPK